MKNLFSNDGTYVLNHKWPLAVKREHEIYDRGNSIRSDFDRDYTRLLHCQAYSRLKHKTQVFYSPRNDHVCTRMEHVLHVASVASTIAKYLGLNQELTDAIAIGHDIGHAPFGHTGEDILNGLMKPRPGADAPKKFWHERNSLFFADFIETLQDPDGTEQNLNLTYAVRDGLVCHCGEIDQQGLKPRNDAINLYDIKRPGFVQPFTWEGCIVKLSDKIAFLGRDLQDARRYHMLDMSCYRQLREIVYGTLGLTSSGEILSHSSGHAINTTVLINDMVVDLCRNSSPEEGLCFSQPYFRFITELKKFSFEKIYCHWRLLEFKSYAENILRTIFKFLVQTQSFAKNGRIPVSMRYCKNLCTTFEDWLVRYSNYVPEDFPDKKKRLKYNTPIVFDVNDYESYEKCVIEYISGMTDAFAIDCFNEIITF